MTYFWKKLLSHEIFRSMVSWAMDFLKKNFEKCFCVENGSVLRKNYLPITEKICIK